MKSTSGFVFVGSILAGLAHAQTTQRVSVDSAGMQSNGLSQYAAISANGRYVVFSSAASNLVASDTNSAMDVFLRDLQTSLTSRVSISSSGMQSNGPSFSYSLSEDGRYVAFESFATNLVTGDTNGTWDVFVRDVQAGQTTRVSVDSAGVEGNDLSRWPTISATGRYVAFVSYASNLVVGDTNGFPDIFVRDLMTNLTTRVNLGPAGEQGNDFLYPPPSISSDGRYVGFSSSATNLVTGDTNMARDIFVRDRVNATTTRVSVDSAGMQSNGDSYWSSMSADGRYVAFESDASNLVPGATTAHEIFVRDLVAGVTTRVSVDSSGMQGNGNSYRPFISSGGRYVAFESDSSDLVADDTNVSVDVFVHDRMTATTTIASIDSAGALGNFGSFFGTISTDGRYVAYFSISSNLVAGDTNSTWDVFTRDRVGSNLPAAYCFGDGSGTACPCGNSGSPLHGCENSAATGGGLLASAGMASVSADTFRLDGSGMPATASALFFQGSAPISGGLGTVFGDGLRCAGGSVIRLGTKFSVAGMSSYGAPLGDTPISVRGMIPAGGGTFVYQIWYRNAAAFCTAFTFNLTNGLSVPWVP